MSLPIPAAELARRAKISATLTGRKKTPEHLAAISRALKGRIVWWAHKTAATKRGKHYPAVSASKMGNTSMRDATIKGECVYCGRAATEHDHVVPGQPETVLSCHRCNSSKGRRTPEEWLIRGLYQR